MYQMGMRNVVLLALLLVVGCSPSATAGAAPTASPTASPAGVRREPATLPVFPEEQAVVAALDAAGIRLSHIGGSKFEDLLGERQRARVFIQTSGGAGADVLFLDRPITGVRVCVSRAASGLNRYEVFIADRRVSDGEGTQLVRFSVSDRHFVQAFGDAFHSALMRGLGTREPPC